MAIGTATAIIGSAVIGAGASALSNKSAAKTAAKASNYAADQNAQVSREIYNQTRQDLSPYNQAGQASLAALMQRLNLSAPQGQAPAQPQTTPQAGGFGPTAQQSAAWAAQNPGGRSAFQMGGVIPQGDPQVDLFRPVRTPQPGDRDYAAYQEYLANGGVPPVGGQGGGVPGVVSEPGSKDLYATRAANAAQPDGAAYMQANPDVQAEFQRNMGSAKGREYLASLGADTPEGFAQYHYDTFGKNEGRQLPMTQPQAQAPGPAAGGPAPAGPAPAQPGTNLMSAQRPAAAPAPTFTRPAALQAPGMPTFDYKSIENDPGYQWELDETLDGVNAASAVRGKLRSGDAARELAKEASGLSHRFTNDYFNRQMQMAQLERDDYRFQQGRNDLLFENDRGYGTDAYRWDTNRNDNIFDTDRGYQTSRYDQDISNLFGLAGMGQNAAAGQASAGNVFAQNTINSNNQRAATTANAAIAGAQNMGNVFGSAAQAVGTYYGMRGGSKGTF